MKLAALLAKLSRPALEGLEVGCLPADSIEGKDIQDQDTRVIAAHLAGQLRSKAALAGVLALLRPWTAEVLRMVVRCFGPLPFEMVQLEPKALEQGYCGAHVKASLTILRQRGLLFVLRKAWGEELFVLPEDTLPIWLELLFPGALRDPILSVQEYGEAIGETGFAAYDVLHLLYLVNSKQLLTTKQGTLTKAALKKLEKSLILSDRDVELAGIITSSQHPYGPAAASVLHIAVCSGLLLRTEDLGWRVCSDVFFHWINRSLLDVQRELYCHWIKAARTSEIWELHAIACLEQADRAQWYMLDRLFEWLRDCGMIKSITDKEQQNFLESRLLPMQAFGWIQLCQLPDGLAFRVTCPSVFNQEEFTDYYSGFIVQSDLELILPPYPPLWLLWNVMAWSEPVTRGEMSVYRLTKDSINRAAERGIDSESIIQILTKNSMVPLDQRLCHTIKEWSNRQAVPVQTQNDRQKGCVVDRIPEGILTPHLQEPDYSPAPVQEGMLREEWHDVPTSWWRGSARYHPSTEKEIVRKAIERKAVISLTLGTGAEDAIVPLLLKETKDGWMIEGMLGRNRITLHSDEWEKIKLIIPGLSD